MKKIIFFVAFLFFAGWIFWKHGFDSLKPLPSSPTSSFEPSSSSINFSFGSIGNKITEWTKGFTIATSSPMNENFSGHMISLNFPKSYFMQGISQAIIDGGVGESFCTSTLKTGEVLTAQGQKSIAGVSFNKYLWQDAGAGNLYQGIVYSTRKNNTCYAFTLFLHTTQIENYANSEADAKQLRIEHDVAVKKIVESFENMVSSF